MRKTRVVLSRFMSLLALTFTAVIVSAEPEPADAQFVIKNGTLQKGWEPVGWGGVSTAQGDGGLAITPSDHATPWCGAGLKAKSPILFSAPIVKTCLVLQVNGTSDSFGAHIGGQRVYLMMNYQGKEFTSQVGRQTINKYLAGGLIDDNPSTWQTVVIPLKNLEFVSSQPGVDVVSFQFSGAPPKTGIQIRNLYFTATPPAIESAAQSGSSGAFATATSKDVAFPALSEIPQSLITPRNATVTVSPAGNYLVNGKPRYFIGTEVEPNVISDSVHRPGYAEKYNWIYDEPLTWESATRLGFDSIGIFFPDTWLLRHDPRLGVISAKDVIGFDRFLENINLPAYIDMTCEEWTHGKLIKSRSIPADAKSNPEKSHYLRYSILHPDGIALYKEFITYIAEYSQKHGVKPLFYELFNEPAYRDDNNYNRGLFVEYLKKNYKTIENLNKVWHTNFSDFPSIAAFKTPNDGIGLFVDWCKFMEESFTAVCRMAKAAVRAVDPQGRTCVQLMGAYNSRCLPASMVNAYEFNKEMDVISLPTCGGVDILGSGITTPPSHCINSGSLVDKENLIITGLYQNFADGKKPVNDDEMTLGSGQGRKELINSLWIRAARGHDADYLFKWEKRPHEYKDEDSGRKLALKYSFMWKNPFCRSTDILGGLLDFKKEFQRAESLLIPKPRGIDNRVALLVSFPTERVAGVTASEHNEVLSYAHALTFGHWGWDVLLEEQITEERLDHYNTVILAGVKNCYAWTMPALLRFAERGGTVIMAIELPDKDEYDNPLPCPVFDDLSLGEKSTTGTGIISLGIPRWDKVPGELKGLPFRRINAGRGWETAGTVGGKQAVVKKTIGKGAIWYVGIKCSEYGRIALLGSILGNNPALRVAEITDAATGELAPNVEVRPAVRGEKRVFFLFNWDLYGKLVRLSIPGGTVVNSAWDTVDAERYEMPANGGLLVYLPPQNRKIVVLSTLADAPESLALVTEKDLRTQKESAQRGGTATAIKKSEEAAPVYKLDNSKAKVIDVRHVCNRKFFDGKEGDGKRGWTRQGESLQGLSDGIQNFLGVPFDIVRWDMNNNTSCLILGSKQLEGDPASVTGISVDENVCALYFLTATAKSVNGAHAMTFRIRYLDGSAVDIPIVVGKNTADWMIPAGKTTAGEAKVAWQNPEKKGLWAWRWENPSPDKLVKEIEVISAMGQTIPILVAITAEKL